MDEAIEIGKLLHDTPDLFPWVCLSIILIVCAAQHKRILGYSVKIDRGESRRLIQFHEQVSKERNEALLNELSHVQTVVNRIDETVSSNSESIKIVEDRTRQ